MIATPEDLIRRLHALTDRTRATLDSRDARFDTVERINVEHLSEQLKRAGTLLGLDAPLARRLLSLREELDSHLLTATAIAGCDLDDATALRMVRRGVDAVATGLPTPGDPLLAPVAVH
jgi:hypothetical protein